MLNNLGGTIFIRNGLKYDYCFVESINSLKELCDEVVVCDAGSTDGTIEILKKLEDAKTKIIYRHIDEWDNLRHLGKDRLNYFTNIAIENLTTEWNFYQQADEILSEKSYDYVYEAIKSGLSNSYFIHRINLWGSPNTRLNLTQSRMPCSEIIVRLAKSKYRTYSDAESIAVDEVSDAYLHKIKMYHFGFVRKPEIMLAKAINMQEEVFQMGGHDVKLDNCEKFIPERWFSGEDLVPIDEPLPKIIRAWAAERE